MASRTDAARRLGDRRRESNAQAKRVRARLTAVPGAEKIAGVVITHPDRVLYTEQGVRKRDLAAYYAEVADWMLPHVVGRPLSIVRCPEGQQKSCFFQKHVGDAVPEPLGHIRITEESGEVGFYPVVNNVAGLIALVQMGVLEIHTWGSRAETVEMPDRLVFDLDPGEEVTFDRVTDAARVVRSRLREHNLECWVKTTGGKGLHLMVPIQPRHAWNEVHRFAADFARSCTQEAPGMFTTNPSKSARLGKIFLDYIRNTRGATVIAPYSTRARKGAPVATPLRWDELGDEISAEAYTLQTLPRRMARLRSDPWAAVAGAKQELPVGVPRR